MDRKPAVDASEREEELQTKLSIAPKKRYIIAIIIVAVVIIAGAAGGYSVYSNTGTRLVDKQLSLGDKYLMELNYEAAIVAFNKVIEIDPKNVEAYQALVYIYDKTGNEDSLNKVIDQIKANGLSELLAYGKMVGMVCDAEASYIEQYNDGLPDVKISVSQDSKDIIDKVTDAEGQYTFTLREGKYSIRAECQGYITATIEVIVGDQVVYPQTIRLVKDSGRNGIAAGVIIDSLTGQPIPGASISINKTSSVDHADTVALTSDSKGTYTTELAAGYYTANISAVGYTSLSLQIIAIGDMNVENQNGTMTPILKDGQIRIILTWGKSPEDLDSHLTGPSPEDRPFHIFYSHKATKYNSEIMSDLDLDDTMSYGPETTTIYKAVPGTYSFFVHDFTNKDNENSKALANSGAKVQVYIGSTLANEFYVPSTLVGNTWHVFDIINDDVSIPTEAQFNIKELESDAYDNGWIKIAGDKLKITKTITETEINTLGFTRDMTLLDLVDKYGLPENYTSLDNLNADMNAGALTSTNNNPTSASWPYDQGIFYASFDAKTWKAKAISLNITAISLPNGIQNGMSLKDIAEILEIDPAIVDLGKLDSKDSIITYCSDNKYSAKVYEEGFIDVYLTRGCFRYSEYTYQVNGENHTSKTWNLDIYDVNSVLSLTIIDGLYRGASINFNSPPED